MNLKNLSVLIFTLFVFSACQEGGEENKEEKQETTTEQESTDPQSEMPNQPAQPELTEVSDEDLEMFASALGEIQMINQMAQQQMIGAVEEAGLEVQRFSQIQQAQESPDQESDATEEEMSQFQAAIGELDKIQTEAEENMIQKIKDQGLTDQRYEEIGMSLQSSPELQQKFQEMMGQQQQQPQAPAQ